jgi:hypothetical protein
MKPGDLVKPSSNFCNKGMWVDGWNRAEGEGNWKPSYFLPVDSVCTLLDIFVEREGLDWFMCKILTPMGIGYSPHYALEVVVANR